MQSAQPGKKPAKKAHKEPTSKLWAGKIPAGFEELENRLIRHHQAKFCVRTYTILPLCFESKVANVYRKIPTMLGLLPDFPLIPGRSGP